MTGTYPCLRRRLAGGAGFAALATGGLLLAAATGPAAAAVEAGCVDELRRIEAQVQGADLTRAQAGYIRDLLDSAETFAENGNLRGCRQTIVDLAEYVQEESIDVRLAARARDWAPFVADTPENLRSQPPEPAVTVPEMPVRVGETEEPLPVPEADDAAEELEDRIQQAQAASVQVERSEPQIDLQQDEPSVTFEEAEPNIQYEGAEPNVQLEQGEPNIQLERAEPNITLEQGEPNVVIEQAEPTVRIERIPSGGSGTGGGSGGAGAGGSGPGGSGPGGSGAGGSSG